MQDSDDVLVARCRDDDDEHAFAELVRRYRDPVFRLAASILGHGFEAEAEEVAQEVFIRVHAALRSFRGESRFSTWLYRIAFNHALNVKSRIRYRAPHLAEDTLVGRASPERGPFDRLADVRRARAVLDCVAELPQAYQSAVRLYYWMDASVAEIAALLGVPENTVKGYLHRARRHLESMLKQRGIS